MSELKQQRTSAKSRFTRTVNILLSKLDHEVSDDSLVTSILDDVREAYQNVNTRHDAYFASVMDTGANSDAEDDWINDIQNTFYDTQQKVNAFRSNIKNKIVVESARRTRDISYQNFRAVCLKLEETLALNSSVDSIERLRIEIQSQFSDVKIKHNEFMVVTTDNTIDQQEWLSEVIKELAIANNSIDNRVLTVNNRIPSKKATSGTIRNSLQLEKFPLPKFDGDLRSYPRFRRDFVQMVLPSIDSKQASFVLRNCLSKDVERSIASCEDDVNIIIQRLDDRYGDPSKLTDSIISDIKGFKYIEVGDSKGLIAFISTIEIGYNDLMALQLEGELCNANIVSIIEGKLPRTLALEWYREIHKDNSKIDKKNKFPHILNFLKVERKALEYGLSDLRSSSSSSTKYGKINEFNVPIPVASDSTNCLLHGAGNHGTSECRRYVSFPLIEKFKLLRENYACYNCLEPGHLSIDCKTRKACGITDCNRFHHPSLHETYRGASNVAISTSGPCLLQIMKIPVKGKYPGDKLNVFWDSGATISLIRKEKAVELGLKGIPVTLNVTTVGGVERRENSYKYQVHLINQNGQVKVIEAYSMERITNEISSIDISTITALVDNIDAYEICRPSGTVDLLIGFEYAAWHPVKLQAVGHLLVLSNMFGKCLAGSHPLIQENTEIEITNVSISYISLSQFFSVESMGVECHPKCGSCRCGKCAPGSKGFTLKEERELSIMEKNLIHVDDHFEVTYPWNKDPYCLPDNKSIALKRLFQLEKRLSKDKEWKRIYSEQMQDMLNRRVARKLTQEEINKYDGPVHYITHHAIIKKESLTTPIRIVFNSSLNFKGHVLNEYWAKGPADGCVNNLLKILMRFRENYCGFAGDISKMYHMIKISQLDQHTHRFLWRGGDSDQPVDILAMTSVSFGDKPAGAIAILALRKAAELQESEYHEASSVIKDSSYVDDIIDSVDTHEHAVSLTSDIDNVLKVGNFTVKQWTLSGGTEEAVKFNAEEKVLGILWNPSSDTFSFRVKMSDLINQEVNSRLPNITKRIALSVVNGLFDPLGLVSPIIVKGKILLRQITAIEPKIGWDDKVPEEHHSDWQSFLKALSSLQEISFTRCVMPINAVGLPTIVTYSDASENIYGVCCYIRWETATGEFKSKLLISKNRVAPIKRLTIVRLELLAAVLAARIRQFVTTTCRFKFARFIHIVDSEIVRAMIQKESYGFNTFVGTRIGEIQTHTDPNEWYWIKGNENIADIITRGAEPSNIDSLSVWQNGPKFMSEAIDSWPISKSNSVSDLPERKKTILTTVAEEEKCVVDIKRFSKYVLLIMVTARILKLKENLSFSVLGKPVSAEEFRNAEDFWVIESQKSIKEDLLQGINGRGRFKRFTPKLNESGVIVIGGRAERWVEISYNKQELPILPKDHRLSLLYARYLHDAAHLGIDADIAKIRAHYWILGLSNIVKSIRNKCTMCRKKYLNITSQLMGKLPVERLKPAPAFFHSMVDLFGPYLIRGEVNKRASLKVYGVLITDLLTRAVYVDIAADYTTDSFLMVFRRFVCLHGYPNVIFSDRGSQLVSASQELKGIVDKLDWDKIERFGSDSGLNWKFSPADSPWWNGCAEALVRSAKKAITHAVGDSRLTFNELQTIFFECANLVNERPIGIKPSKEQDFVYLCPNDILLGRSTSKLPHGQFSEDNSLIKRLLFIESLVDSFWTKWSRNYFPSLLIQQKWHHARRNAAVGDIVIIQDSSLSRGQWKLGRITKVNPGMDGIVRRVEIQYKNKDNDKFTTIDRSVQRVIVILPIEEITIIK